MTSLTQLAWFYTVWVAASAGVLWVLAQWAARRRLHGGVLLIAAILTLVCVGLLVYALVRTGGPPESALQRFLAYRGSILLLGFLVWPFLACAAVAQISRHFVINARAGRWLSFASGMVISCLCPFALLAAGCGLAGACF